MDSFLSPLINLISMKKLESMLLKADSKFSLENARRKLAFSFYPEHYDYYSSLTPFNRNQTDSAIQEKAN